MVIGVAPSRMGKPMNRILTALPLAVAVAASTPLHAQKNPNSVEIEGHGTLHGIYIDDISVKAPRVEVEYGRDGDRTLTDIEIFLDSESYFDVNWYVTWEYRIEVAATPDMREILLDDKLKPFTSSILYILVPGEEYYIRAYVVRNIQDTYGDVRRDETLRSGVYRLKAFDFAKISHPPKHEGPIKRKVAERKVKEADKGFVTID